MCRLSGKWGHVRAGGDPSLGVCADVLPAEHDGAGRGGAKYGVWSYATVQAPRPLGREEESVSSSNN